MKDPNRSKDVAGPAQEREDFMPDMGSVPSSHQHKTMSVAFKDLHDGHLRSPMQGLGQQLVKEGSSTKGYDSKDSGKPIKQLAKENVKQGSRNPKGMGRSMAKVEMSKEKAKAKTKY